MTVCTWFYGQEAILQALAASRMVTMPIKAREVVRQREGSPLELPFRAGPEKGLVGVCQASRRGSSRLGRNRPLWRFGGSSSDRMESRWQERARGQRDF
ncbi:hypothetical protein MPNT_190003 [Candidatus Methylacidithermus pantelleriae]|uniref:Uncharacterized protein n=1 Tax=Candidatus Methylacidithermus pantelleriae TaxID=2744239 RepID=A0A8J2BHL1_9BACT|nr:hypothetical protein MPNT_190003 [Candidatus Methylacidithermus pantelleriae]